MMGLLLVIPALLLGNSAVGLLLLFPLPVLGLLMIYVGLEHARLVRSLRGSPAAMCIAMIIGVVALAWRNVALGLAVGLAVSTLIREPHLRRLADRFSMPAADRAVKSVLTVSETEA